MKLKKLLCSSAAALIAVSVPFIGMSAFGEDAGADAANALTAETTEALSTTETEEPELDEVEKAHQLLLCRYDFVEDDADNFYKTTDLDLDGLWDFDNIRVKVAAKNGRIDSGKLYLASKSGAWDDVLLRELSLRSGQDTVNMGFIRDTFSGDLTDAYLKLVVDDMSNVLCAGIKVNSTKDKHLYDEWIEDVDENGNTIYTFYGRNYNKDYINTKFGFDDAALDVYVGDFTGKFATDETIGVDITGELYFAMFNYIDGELQQGSELLHETNHYKGPLATDKFDGKVHFCLQQADQGSVMTLEFVRVNTIDYAGEVDESIDVSVPYTLKNAATYDGGHQYDVSMLPAIDGKFVFEFEPFDDKNYNAIYLYSYGCNDVYTKTPVEKGETTAELTVTADEMEILRNRTVTFDVQDLKVSKVSFVATPRSPENFEYGDNKCDITLDSKQEYVWIPGSAFEKLTPKGTAPVTITFETDSSVSDPWVQYRFGTTDLHKLTDVESVKGKTTFECKLYTDVTKVQEHGLYIYGNGITITNVNINRGIPCTGDGSPDYVDLTEDEIKDVELISAPEDESAYTSPLNDFGVNKMYSQKNELGDGTYNQRFLMQVKTADVADVECYGIIVSSGDKHVYINCYGLSSSITINGNSIKADEGCVFLSAAVVGVNDDITLSYSEFVYD